MRIKPQIYNKKNPKEWKPLLINTTDREKIGTIIRRMQWEKLTTTFDAIEALRKVARSVKAMRAHKSEIGKVLHTIGQLKNQFGYEK